CEHGRLGNGSTSWSVQAVQEMLSAAGVRMDGLYASGMERGFMSQKGSDDGKGVKEKNQDSHDVVANDVVLPSVVDEPVVTISSNNSEHRMGMFESSRRSVNFRTLITPMGNGTDVAIPLESIRAISKQYDNMAYGFFLGKRVAYPVVPNYNMNTLGKYGLIKSMLNSST
nr:hypothetical protein [Tanacetum cinerariifolium]